MFIKADSLRAVEKCTAKGDVAIAKQGNDMKIAYITTISPYDKYSWSGTNYYVRAALEARGCEVYCIYGYRKITLGMVFRKLWARLRRKNYQAIRSVASAKGWARHIERHLEQGTDAVLSLSTIPIAYLKTDIPVFVYIDGCYEYMLGQGFNRLMNSLGEAHLIEQLAFGKCMNVFTPSFASADAIVRHYGLGVKEKVKVIPLGANIDKIPTMAEVMDNIRRKDMSLCRILFVGVDWKRKGADIVLDAVRLLHESGFPVELHLVGLRDVPAGLPSYVVNHGFISKMQVGGMDRLAGLYRDAHFLFVPSVGEAYGLVFCEAGAYGLPSISHAVGGIKTIIKNGVNGQLFDVGTPPQIFADYIKKVFLDAGYYERLSISTYERFKEELNWDVSAAKIMRLMGVCTDK